MKFMVLKTRLGLPRYQAIGLLEGLWYLTATNAQDGAVGRFSDLEIAAWLEYPGDPGAMISALVDAGFLDRSETHRLVVHDWHEHAPMHIKANMAKHKKSFARGEIDPATEEGSHDRTEEGSADNLAPLDVALDDPSGFSLGGSLGSIPPNQTKPNQTKPKGKTSSSCPERPRSRLDDDTPTAHVLMPLSGKSASLAITEGQVETFGRAYPGVDVMAELRRMNAWLEANPMRRKTHSGALKFVNAWLSRAQNDPRPGRPDGGPGRPSLADQTRANAARLKQRLFGDSEPAEGVVYDAE